jgi:ABC-type uncharacterized transport system auxiliary subunit
MRTPSCPGRGRAVRDALILGGMAAALLLFAACAATPETRYFRVEFPLPAPSPNSPLPLTLAIARLTAPEPYQQERIIYRVSPYVVQYYTRDQWESPPVDMVNDRLFEQFTASGRFQRVVLWRRGEGPAYLLEARLRRFEELDEADTWYGLVELEYELLDRDGRSLLRQVASQRIRVESRNPEGTVEALSRGLRGVLDEVLAKTLAALQERRP